MERMMVPAYVVAAMIVGQSVLDDSALPERLRSALQRRAAETSYVEWTLEHRGNWRANLVGPYVEHLVTQTVGDSVLETNTGDAAGEHPIMRKDAEDSRSRGEVPPTWTDEMFRAVYTAPKYAMTFDGDFWSKMGPDYSGPIAVTTPGEAINARHPLDLRLLGASPRIDERYSGVLDALGKQVVGGLAGAVYTLSSSGAIDTITAQFDDYRLEWDLDTARGDQPVRAAYYSVYSDQPLSVSETDLQRIGSRWYPRSVRFYSRNYQGGAEPHLLVSIDQASFDQEWHRREPFTPRDIGVLFGAQISVSGRHRRGDGSMHWDGTQLISNEEWYDLIWGYEVNQHPAIEAWMAETSGITVEEHRRRVKSAGPRWRAEYERKHGEPHPFLALSKDDRPDEWDVYVEEFIEKHKLDEARVQKARDLLKRAKSLRDFHQRKIDAEVNKAQREEATARAEHLEKAGKERIQAIFDTVLLRGLNLLIPKEKKTD